MGRCANIEAGLNVSRGSVRHVFRQQKDCNWSRLKLNLWRMVRWIKNRTWMSNSLRPCKHMYLRALCGGTQCFSLLLYALCNFFMNGLFGPHCVHTLETSWDNITDSAIIRLLLAYIKHSYINYRFLEVLWFYWLPSDELLFVTNLT